MTNPNKFHRRPRDPFRAIDRSIALEMIRTFADPTLMRPSRRLAAAADLVRLDDADIPPLVTDIRHFDRQVDERRKVHRMNDGRGGSCWITRLNKATEQ